MGFGIVGPVSLRTWETVPWMARFAGHRGYGIDQGQQLRHFMSVGGRQRDGPRNAMAVGKNMLFAPIFLSIRRIWAGLRPPKTARIEVLSTTACDQSILSASRSLLSNTWCNCCQTPHRCQSCRRRQSGHAGAAPHFLGQIFPRMPVLSTNRMPWSAWRLSMGLRPGCRNRLRFSAGKIGSINFHKSSSSNCWAIIRPPCPTAN